MPDIKNILVVCVGNICRSPTAEFLLRRALPDRNVSSAGLAALVGYDMEAMARAVAEENGLPCPVHQARQLTPSLCHEADLILVMEAGHKEGVTALCPEARGKVFLLAQGAPSSDIGDPYRKGRPAFERAYQQIGAATALWTKRLLPNRPQQGETTK